MNERIRELADEAAKFSAIMALPADESGDKLFVEKFAELIVEEMYVFMCDATDNDKPWPTFKEVKEHFGVEE